MQLSAVGFSDRVGSSMVWDLYSLCSGLPACAWPVVSPFTPSFIWCHATHSFACTVASPQIWLAIRTVLLQLIVECLLGLLSNESFQTDHLTCAAQNAEMLR